MGSGGGPPGAQAAVAAGRMGTHATDPTTRALQPLHDMLAAAPAATKVPPPPSCCPPPRNARARCCNARRCSSRRVVPRPAC